MRQKIDNLCIILRLLLHRSNAYTRLGWTKHVLLRRPVQILWKSVHSFPRYVIPSPELSRNFTATEAPFHITPPSATDKRCGRYAIEDDTEDDTQIREAFQIFDHGYPQVQFWFILLLFWTNLGRYWVFLTRKTAFPFQMLPIRLNWIDQILLSRLVLDLLKSVSSFARYGILSPRYLRISVWPKITLA